MNTNTIIEKIKTFGTILVNEPMSNHTSFKTGGPADILIYPDGKEKTAQLVKTLYNEQIDYCVLGGCTNLVVGDGGIKGVVIKISDDKGNPAHLRINDNGSIYADASATKSDFIQFAIDNGFEGIEFMVGVPGCIGGGIIMNAGTFMGTFVDILQSILYINLKGEIKELIVEKNMAHYRHLELESDVALVLGANFILPKTNNKAVIKEKVDDIIQDRKQKHPWNFPSAGSVFKNPPNEASWKLVNDCGLKGYTLGGAQVSDKHTNFIVNSNNASSAEIRALVAYVQSQVKIKFAIDLHTEIRMIGEFI